MASISIKTSESSTFSVPAQRLVTEPDVEEARQKVWENVNRRKKQKLNQTKNHKGNKKAKTNNYRKHNRKQKFRELHRGVIYHSLKQRTLKKGTPQTSRE